MIYLTIYKRIKPTNMLVIPRKRKVLLSIWAAVINTLRIPSGFKNGIKPSRTKTNANAANRSEKLISSKHCHHFSFFI